MSTTTVAPAARSPAQPVGDLAGRRRGNAWLLALPSTVATLLVVGYRAGDRQLWEDEYATWHASTLDYPDFFRLISHTDLELAPYYVLMHGWVTVLGDSPLALRTPSVIAMALSAGLLTLVGSRLFRPDVGVMAGLLFATIPSISRYAHEARPFAIAMCLALLATLLLLHAIDRPTWPRWMLYGMVLVLLGFANIVALVGILCAHLLAVCRVARAQETLVVWRWLGPLVLTATAVGPFTLAAAAQTRDVSWLKADMATLRAFPAQLFGSAAVAAAVAVLAVVGLFSLVRSAGPQLSMLAAWSVGPPVFTLLTFPIFHLFHHRNLIFTVAAWLLLAATGVDAVVRALVVRRRGNPATGSVGGSGPASGAAASTALASAAVAVVTVATIGWLAIPGHQPIRHDPLLGSPDYRRAALRIRADLQPGDAIAYGGFDLRNRRAMTYEMRAVLRPRDVFLYQSAERLGWYSARECPQPAACLGATRRVWLVNTARSTDVFAELPPLTAALFRDRATIVATQDFQRLHLVLLAIDSNEPG